MMTPWSIISLTFGTVLAILAPQLAILALAYPQIAVRVFAGLGVLFLAVGGSSFLLTLAGKFLAWGIVGALVCGGCIMALYQSVAVVP